MSNRDETESEGASRVLSSVGTEQLFPAACGNELENIGEQFGVDRRDGESEDEYRDRVLTRARWAPYDPKRDDEMDTDRGDAS